MFRKLATAVTATLLLSQSAVAGDYLEASVGYFDITQRDNTATQYGLGYRYDDIFHGLRPGVGFMATSDSAMYGYAGFYWDVPLTSNLLIVPNVVMGGYSKGSDGKDLGHGVEFRSGIEVDYQFETGARVGLAFNHLSNAGIGNDNPGTEVLMLVLQHPLEWFGEKPKKKRWWDKNRGY